HLNQIWGEVAAVQEQRGVLPTEYVARTGFLSDRLVAAHCRCMTAEEERVLGASQAAVAVNPAIAARRGLAARIDEPERAGCLITLGTDTMDEDMGEALRPAVLVARVRRAGRRPLEHAGWPRAHDGRRRDRRRSRPHRARGLARALRAPSRPTAPAGLRPRRAVD